MSLEAQIALLTNPRDFTRLCDALLTAEYGDDYLAIDDDRADAGNDGYLRPERRMYAMHCFKRIQNQGIESAIRSKMLGDIGKAIALRDAGSWEVDRWTFLSNYPVPHSIATQVLALAEASGIEASWMGPEALAGLATKHPSVLERFPSLQAPGLARRLDQLGASVSSLARAGYLVPEAAAHLPTDAIQQQAMIADQPPAWEYLLFGGVLVEQLARLEDLRFDHELGLTSQAPWRFDLAEAGTVMGSHFQEFSDALAPISRLFEPEVKEQIFGADGEPGDAARIVHCARRVIRFYEYALLWVAHVRAASCHPLFDPVLEAMAHIADGPIENVRTFVLETADQLALVPELLATETEDDPARLQLTLRFELDHEATQGYDRALADFFGTMRGLGWDPEPFADLIGEID